MSYDKLVSDIAGCSLWVEKSIELISTGEVDQGLGILEDTKNKLSFIWKALQNQMDLIDAEKFIDEYIKSTQVNISPSDLSDFLKWFIDKIYQKR